MTAAEWQIVRFTLGVSAFAIALIVPPGLLLAWLLARRDWPGKSLLETVVALPLVLPPVATGRQLLKAGGRRGPLGAWLHSRGLDLVFTWRGVVLAMAVMSFPLLVRGARSAFEEVDPRLEQMARTLGAGGLRIFLTVTLPLAARGILGGTLLAFARSIGEFGATIVVAGNIPGRTSTLSLAIYQLIQLGQDEDAFRLLAAAAVIAFAAVWAHEVILQRTPRP
jgi:molybdate transport system permease protein